MLRHNPRIEDARTRALAAHHARRPAPEVCKLMTDWKAQGKGLREIARDLNRLNIRTPRGRQWYASSVRNHLMLHRADGQNLLDNSTKHVIM